MHLEKQVAKDVRVLVGVDTDVQRLNLRIRIAVQRIIIVHGSLDFSVVRDFEFERTGESSSVRMIRRFPHPRLKRVCGDEAFGGGDGTDFTGPIIAGCGPP